MTTDPTSPVPTLESILIVDDEWMMVEVMTAILNRLNYHDIDFASDGSAALRMMQSKAYGLVISDLNMGSFGGLDLLRKVRADVELKHTPFILTTASREAESVLAAKRLGADHYLLKPFTPRQLAEKIEIILRRLRPVTSASSEDSNEQKPQCKSLLGNRWRSETD
jgi:two-component system chemotaxis response regulator CheY